MEHGIDVHRDARIAAVGHGGQVYQLEVPGLQCDFPLLKPIEAGTKNLPVTRTSRSA